MPVEMAAKIINGGLTGNESIFFPVGEVGHISPGPPRRFNIQSSSSGQGYVSSWRHGEMTETTIRSIKKGKRGQRTSEP